MSNRIVEKFKNYRNDEETLMPESISKQNFLRVRTASQCLEDAKNMPIPNLLISELWCEGELGILFSDTNVGKSIFAVQSADGISRGQSKYGFNVESQPQTVLYYDFEMSDKQFQKRYSANYENNYQFHPNFLRVEIIPDAVDFQNFEQALFDNFERNILEYKAKILVVDNITYLRSQATDTSKEALPLMRLLNKLKKQYGLSILALAHTPKRDASRPITVNDLSGSKIISNFADCIFAIGRSNQDKDLRYIKQLKVRGTDMVYDADEVMVCRITQPSNFLHFEFLQCEPEREHLKIREENEMSEREQKILELKKSTDLISNYQIAKTLKTHETTVARTLKKHGLQ